jgi:hypothetical protein
MGPEVLAVMTAVSTVVSAGAQFMQGQSAARAASANAAMAEEEAQRARQTAAVEEQRNRDQSRRIISAQRAAYGASGVVSEEGSPLLALADSASEAELDALTIRYSGATQARRLQAQAASDRASASGARMQGLVGAGTTLLGGAVRVNRILNPAPAPAPRAD